MTCSHTITQGREGENGSWCVACGEKIYEVDDRECKDCDFARKLLGGWICHRHLMAIAPSMNVTFKISEGSCWTPSNAALRGRASAACECPLEGTVMPQTEDKHG